MGTTFNSQILVEKLAKLNNSQQSIETLSHWCIFHMNKAKQVVETWARQFHSSPRDQRVAFLYLANDILQNSRRKGTEFFAEFWKVLPDALRDVIENGDEFGRNAALRLINIWEERKIFGSRGQLLKEGLMGKQLDNINKIVKPPGFKLRQSAGNVLEKIVSEYQNIYGGQLDEDVVLGKCKNAISCVEKVDKEIGGDIRSGQVNGSGIVDELKGQHAILGDCIEQLKAVESSRANLVTYLHQALQDQELKLEQTRNQLQGAQSRSELADSYCRQLINPNTSPMLADQNMKETHTSKAPHSYISGNGEQSAPVMYTRQVPPFPEKSGHIGEDTKSAAAAVAAKLTASTSSAQMLTYVLSSLASEGVIGSSNSMKKESSTIDYAPEKRTKIDNEYSHSQYVPSPNSQPPVPSFPHPDSLQHNNNNTPPPPPATSHEMAPSEPPPPPPPPPPSSPPPPLPPMPPTIMQPYQIPQFMQTAGSVTYSYGPPPPQPPMPGYSSMTPNGVSPFTPPPPPNTYQTYEVEGGYYSQPSAMPTVPVSRQ